MNYKYSEMLQMPKYYNYIYIIPKKLATNYRLQILFLSFFYY